MKSKEYLDLFDSIGYLVDEVNRMGESVDDIDESKKKEYIELNKKVEDLISDAEAINREMELLD